MNVHQQSYQIPETNLYNHGLQITGPEGFSDSYKIYTKSLMTDIRSKLWQFFKHNDKDRDQTNPIVHVIKVWIKKYGYQLKIVPQPSTVIEFLRDQGIHSMFSQHSSKIKELVNMIIGFIYQLVYNIPLERTKLPGPNSPWENYLLPSELPYAQSLEPVEIKREKKPSPKAPVPFIQIKEEQDSEDEVEFVKCIPSVCSTSTVMSDSSYKFPPLQSPSKYTASTATSSLPNEDDNVSNAQSEQKQSKVEPGTDPSVKPTKKQEASDLVDSSSDEFEFKDDDESKQLPSNKPHHTRTKHSRK